MRITIAFAALAFCAFIAGPAFADDAGPTDGGGAPIAADATQTDVVDPPDGGTPTSDLSCVGKCGKYDAAAKCQCDTACTGEGDCCKDYGTVCNKCGDGQCVAPETETSCPADCKGGAAQCGNGKCEGDEKTSCPSDCGDPVGTCKDKCGKFEAGGSCQCDDQCAQYGDCCPDYKELCDGGTGPCEKSCEGKQCGDDNCGGSCGTCTGGAVCDATGICKGGSQVDAGPTADAGAAAADTTGGGTDAGGGPIADANGGGADGGGADTGGAIAADGGATDGGSGPGTTPAPAGSTTSSSSCSAGANGSGGSALPLALLFFGVMALVGLRRRFI